MANTYLTRTFGSATNRTKFTISVWLKKCTINNDSIGGDNDEKHFFNGYYNSSNRFMIYMLNTDNLVIRNVDNGTENVYYKTSANYRDVNGWYHVVVRIDTSQAGGNRIRAYVNGEQITSWASSTEPNQGGDFSLGTNSFTNILGCYAGTNHFWNGGMSHYHYCDGQSYAPTEFGETDSTTGEWKIKTNTNVSYGNEGFFLFDDDNSVTDKSGNGNNFTVGGGTLTKTEDNPSNVFATGNPLYKPRGTVSYTNGNTTFSTNASNWDTAISTICATAGKYYFETKINDNDSTKFTVGAIDIVRDSDMVNNLLSNSYLGFRGMGYYGGGTIIGNNGSSNNSNLITGLTVFGTNDIVGCAVDLDNNKMYWHLNGTYIQNGGYTQNPSSGSYGVDFSNNRDGTNAVGMGSSIRDGRATYTNFGNGYFGTTAVSSAGTNASGNGIFEYDVPTGFTALSTKGLNL
jgi:hypothetical protein